VSTQGQDFWENRYLDGDTPWDKGQAAPPLIEYLSRHVISGTVCVPGCGAGYDVRALARQGADLSGLDIAPSALKKAESFSKVNGEQYQQINWFDLPPKYENRFDWIFEHTCFCAIDPGMRPDYVNSCLRALKTGGHILAIFFMTPDAEEGPPFGTDREELDQLFSPYFKVIRDDLPLKAYPGREGRERMMILQKL